MRKATVFILTALLLLSMLTGCSGGKKKSVSTDGSTSMEKVIGTLGEAYAEANTEVNFTFNPTGSGSGIAAVSEGRCDIGLASRELKPAEKEGGLIETILAYDGIAVVVNPQNPVSDLTLEQVARIYTGQITNWSEAGGQDGAIVVIGREAGSGTRDGFESVIGIKDDAKYRQELTSTGDVITTVSQNPGAIGYGSIASVGSTVKTVLIGGVEPSERNIKNGSYKIQRPFMLITRNDKELSETAQAFFDYITSSEASPMISKAGFVPAN